MRTNFTLTQIEDLAIKAIDKAMQKNELFTAYDITRRLRTENPTIDIQHDQVRDVVQKAWNNGAFYMLGYERELRVITTGVEAYVYGPRDADFAQYQSDIKNAKSQVVEIQATFGGVYSG